MSFLLCESCFHFVFCCTSQVDRVSVGCAGCSDDQHICIKLSDKNNLPVVGWNGLQAELCISFSCLNRMVQNIPNRQRCGRNQMKSKTRMQALHKHSGRGVTRLLLAQTRVGQVCVLRFTLNRKDFDGFKMLE